MYRDDHRTPCKVIKKARLRHKFEEKKLRDTPGDFLTPAPRSGTRPLRCADYRAIEKYNSHFRELLVKDPDAGVLQRPIRPYAQRSKEDRTVCAPPHNLLNNACSLNASWVKNS